jgi:hypothetical protein
VVATAGVITISITPEPQSQEVADGRGAERAPGRLAAWRSLWRPWSGRWSGHSCGGAPPHL